MHTHINRNQRIIIGALLREGYTQSKVAESIGVNKSTISRELQRNNKENGRYHAIHANVLARERRKISKHNTRLIENNNALKQRIEQQLEPLVSPEVIAHKVGIHHQTIYGWIYRSRPDLRSQLPYRGKKRRRYAQKREKYSGWTKKVKTIDVRPDVSISWEGDTVKGDTRAQLLTHVERTSLYTRVDLIPNGTADSVHSLLKRRPIPNQITYDQGSEFALWKMIERDTGADIFFADAHSPWQRGKNENTNGRLRRVWPKRFDFSTITQRDVDRVVYKMNHTPRKSLSWRTPMEVYEELCCVSEAN